MRRAFEEDADQSIQQGTTADAGESVGFDQPSRPAAHLTGDRRAAAQSGIPGAADSSVRAFLIASPGGCGFRFRREGPPEMIQSVRIPASAVRHRAPVSSDVRPLPVLMRPTRQVLARGSSSCPTSRRLSSLVRCNSFRNLLLSARQVYVPSTGVVFESRLEAPGLQAADLYAHCWHRYATDPHSLGRQRAAALNRLTDKVKGMGIYDSSHMDGMLSHLPPEVRKSIVETKDPNTSRRRI